MSKLMKDRGFQCIGCTMKLYNNEDAGIERTRTCCSLDDVEDARSVAYALGMPFYVFNFTDDFRSTVIRRFIDSYEHGITPNPCIDCNRFMKFGKLFDRAKILGCDYVVTGHYARIEEQDGVFLLKKAADESKDQSYVLYAMTQEQLAHVMFPLGGMRKTEVRALAEKCGFVNAAKPDSQDICFVPDGDYAGVIEKHTVRSEEQKKALMNRLKRIEGKVRGLQAMLERDCYCNDILTQSAAVSAAMNAFNKEILASHIHTCVVRDIRDGKVEVVDELLKTMQKLMK